MPELRVCGWQVARMWRGRADTFGISGLTAALAANATMWVADLVKRQVGVQFPVRHVIQIPAVLVPFHCQEVGGEL